MSVKSFFATLGKALAKVLNIGTDVAAAAEPIVDLTVPGIAGVYNLSVTAALQAEEAAQAAAATAATTEAKLAAITAAVTPILNQATAQAGLPPHTQAQIAAYAQSVLAGLEALNTAA